jgi:pimeloyl-ACP methyl ester carboxylesterase
MKRVRTGFLCFCCLVLSGCSSQPYTRDELRDLVRYESIAEQVQTGSAEVRGKRIHYLHMGDGTPLVLLHSFPCSSYEWRHVIPRLARDYAVYAPDLLGYGKSKVEPGVDRSLAAQVAYIAEWMDSAGIPPAVIVGQDIGGGVAQRLAVQYPQRVRGLILINSVCFDSWPYDYSELLAEPVWGKFTGGFFGRRTGLKSQLKQMVYYQRLLSKGVVDNYFEPWAGSSGRQDLILAAESFDNRDTRIIEEGLARIKVPTLVIAGRFDPLQSINYSKRLAGAIPGARFIPIANCGHLASEDEPEKIVRLVRDFMHRY